MKIIVRKNSFLSCRGRLCVNLIIVFIFSLMVFTPARAQNSRPTPTPRPEVPQVISRDEDLTTKGKNSRANEISESDDTEETIILPRQTDSTKTTDEGASTQKQKRMMLYLDLLSKTEERAANLRQQVFLLLEKQNSVSAQIKQNEYQLRPEVIVSSTALTGSLRPEDLRTERKAALELEKTNLEKLLQTIELSRANLEENLRKAELLVERIRARFEQAVEEALNEDEEIFQ